MLCRVGIAILSAGNGSLRVGAVNACVSGIHTGLGFKHVAVFPWGECEYVWGQEMSVLWCRWGSQKTALESWFSSPTVWGSRDCTGSSILTSLTLSTEPSY